MSGDTARPPFELARVVAVAGVAAGARTVVLAASHLAIVRLPGSLVTSVAAATLIEGFVLAVVVALALRWLARARSARPLAFLIAAGAGYAFVTLRAPACALEAPDFGGARSVSVHVVAALLALALALWLVVPGRDEGVGASGTRSTRARVRRLASAFVLVALVGAVVVRAYDRFVRRADAARPNVILVTLASVRGDRLSCAGYPRGTTPNLDAFARTALRFERAYTPHAATVAANASLLTGLAPDAHGVDADHALPADVSTLAEEFARAGFVTWAQLGDSPWTEPRFGFARGFAVQRTIAQGARPSLAALEPVWSALADRRVFLWLQLDDAAADARRWAYEHDAEDGAICGTPAPEGFFGGDAVGRFGARYLAGLNEPGARPPSAAEWAHLVGRYDGGLRSLDRRLGVLWKRLDELGLLERSWVVVTADHGQAFGEDGTFLNAGASAGVARVPLLVRPPGGIAERSVAEPVSTHEVGALLREILSGRPVSERTSAIACVLAGRPTPEPFVVTRAGAEVAVRGREIALVGTLGRLRGFDLRRDPLEETPLTPTVLATRVPKDEFERATNRLFLELARTERRRGPGIVPFDAETARRALWLGEPIEAVRGLVAP